MPEVVGSNPTEGRNNFSAILIFKKNFILHWRRNQFLIYSWVSTNCLIDSGSCCCRKQILLKYCLSIFDSGSLSLTIYKKPWAKLFCLAHTLPFYLWYILLALFDYFARLLRMQRARRASRCSACSAWRRRGASSRTFGSTWCSASSATESSRSGRCACLGVPHSFAFVTIHWNNGPPVCALHIVSGFRHTSIISMLYTSWLDSTIFTLMNKLWYLCVMIIKLIKVFCLCVCSTRNCTLYEYILDYVRSTLAVLVYN